MAEDKIDLPLDDVRKVSIPICGEIIHFPKHTSQVMLRLAQKENISIPQALAKLAELGVKNTPEFIKIPD
ncbi:TPA: hypothetical protein DCZ46_04220 [Candidatus Campbellbacteria bacterium]|nr:MAG: hypothetical protein UR58_C0001G0439 [Candidatus Campbellbacteria bacterium GW2011_OD1_34_28]KKP75043.1 MAG: hypothetical protein UR74_C0002G0309 [Candidatus Campbellbacteria bacterium GW2011_GWD2_35_24]KKP75929.1 MAG: hypothetical protein UR75_C0002G0310 [Candidatus Campbellbacteria bacterium GW2011_GWC2_35_28]KKP76823.1 MAG: hypothetical protein UR76_C0002G0024 [Candidatus Campbellbacteria bacterium GW2011_GWC1_35_31]KKP78749.1 MAG: hypothetical protein UR79_C0002G0024 [Candidatus Cam